MLDRNANQAAFCPSVRTGEVWSACTTILRGFSVSGISRMRFMDSKPLLSSFYPDMIGQLEAVFERPVNNAAVQVAVIRCLLLLAGYGE